MLYDFKKYLSVFILLENKNTRNLRHFLNKCFYFIDNKG